MAPDLPYCLNHFQSEYSESKALLSGRCVKDRGLSSFSPGYPFGQILPDGGYGGMTEDTLAGREQNGRHVLRAIYRSTHGNNLSSERCSHGNGEASGSLNRRKLGSSHTNVGSIQN